MAQRYNFGKEWPRIKKQLLEMSREAVALAKKGEKELIKASHKGKLHIDSTALNLKKEHLYHLIGKEYVKSKSPGTHSAKMKKLLSDLVKLSRESRNLNQQINPKKKATRKKASASVK